MPRHSRTFPKPKNTQRAKHIRNRWLWVAAVIAWYVAISLFLHEPSVQVDSVTISGVNLVSVADVEEAVAPMLDKKMLGLPRNNRLLFPRKKTKRLLFASYPAFDNIRIRIQKQTAHIQISERPPVALWCIPNPTTATERDCMYLDPGGLAMSPAAIEDYGDFLVFFTPEHPPEEFTTRQAPLSKANIDLLYQLQGILEQEGILVPEIAITDEKRVFSLRPSVFNDALFNTETEIHGLLAELATTRPPEHFARITTNLLQQGELADTLDGKYTDLLSLDLRFTENVYYTLLPQGGAE